MPNPNTQIIKQTQSLCPYCLQRIKAWYEAIKGEVYLCKECPEHGVFKVIAWRGVSEFIAWQTQKTKAAHNNIVIENKGCPFDCGLCSRHWQRTCTALIEVTNRCSLACPVCYASSDNQQKDPTVQELEARLRTAFKQTGNSALQLSGGEPTERNDLEEIIKLAKSIGFPFIQLNSNGLRLGLEKGYALKLAKAGLDSVYLQFDGTNDNIFKKLRGRACLAEKNQAIQACSAAGLGIVLVATIVEGINKDNLGELLNFALKCGSSVRGLHLQPVASFGRVPWAIEESKRLTLPDLMHELCAQFNLSNSKIHISDFHPPSCEHSLCSFSALYQKQEDGSLHLIEAAKNKKCCSEGKKIQSMPHAHEAALRSKQFTALHWQGSKQENHTAKLATNNDSLQEFILKSELEKRFTLSAMAFQDSLSVDLERIQACCIHIINNKGDLVPFCAYNLSAVNGETIHRGHN